ncbi:hypothetical protein RxyAA322_22410 [Rubrobacter xylanophilus]|uniref:Uncharacterized protein n=1 Tax=Rubrobacter xylanophilus TaxID=49319 RepID=A0A510HP02_9ACTN|nr:helix-turn-helix domain-containing protein [Rubrobacter xylanophilus]BBL80387.1 hypothetical protein RxyAA322_22410 [Rubrobacter xylanophilus]
MVGSIKAGKDPHLREVVFMDDGGELCLEERVAQLRREGLSAEEIARVMGVDPGWVEALLSAWGED